MGYRIMIVDDSRVECAKMNEMLCDTEIEIAYTCHSGEEAIRVYETVMPDVVTMDVVMPGMDGLATMASILARFPEARILVISSLAYDDTAQWSHELGAAGFLFKPFSKEDLIRSIHEAVLGWSGD